MARPDRTALLDGRRPTLLVAASHDKVFAPADLQGLARAVPGATFTQNDRAGHLVPLEKPKALSGILTHWMRARVFSKLGLILNSGHSGCVQAQSIG